MASERLPASRSPQEVRAPIRNAENRQYLLDVENIRNDRWALLLLRLSPWLRSTQESVSGRKRRHLPVGRGNEGDAWHPMPSFADRSV